MNDTSRTLYRQEFSDYYSFKKQHFPVSMNKKRIGVENMKKVRKSTEHLTLNIFTIRIMLLFNSGNVLVYTIRIPTYLL